MLRNPSCDRVIVGASGNESPERLGLDAGELEKEPIKRAIKMILTECSSDGRATFVEHASGKDLTR